MDLVDIIVADADAVGAAVLTITVAHNDAIDEAIDVVRNQIGDLVIVDHVVQSLRKLKR